MKAPPAAAPPPERYTPAVRLTLAEYQRLLKCTRGSGRPGCHRYYALWVWLGNTGTRISEARLVLVADLDFTANTARIHTLKRRRRRKGRPALEVRAVHPKVMQVLRAHVRRGKLQPGDRLFPMARQVAWEAFGRYAKLAALPAGVSLHSLRHFRGDQDYQATGDLRWVAFRLRHRVLSSTARYTQVGRAQEEELVRKIGAVT